uniref:Uncharacterized protein n=1 Tax=Cucumis melo TaxID=3656 RepID=A0A9I9DXI2_CUCME
MESNDDISISNSMNSIETVIKAVEALPDMDEDLILDAFDFLMDNENKAKVFISMDAKLRRKWLIKKLRPQPEISRNMLNLLSGILNDESCRLSCCYV